MQINTILTPSTSGEHQKTTQFCHCKNCTLTILALRCFINTEISTSVDHLYKRIRRNTEEYISHAIKNNSISIVIQYQADYI